LAIREISTKNQSLNFTFNKGKLLRELLVVISIGLFIGFLAPFGMDELPVFISMSYWVFTCVCGYFVYSPLINLGHKYLSERLSAPWLRVALSSLIASILMSLVVPLITMIFFNSAIDLINDFFNFLPKTLIIGGVITFFSVWQNHVKQQQQQLELSTKVIEDHTLMADAKSIQIEQFMSLLPINKRGQLLCLEMDDHYLKVHTDKGNHMLLMRLKDALLKLEEFPGLQTHRSWWVASDAVVSVNKQNRKMTLLLINHIEVPVSRTFVDAVKAADIY
jgi:hypothetical protein